MSTQQEGKRYFRLQIEQVDGEVETYLDKIVIAKDGKEAMSKAVKLCKEYAAGGTVDGNVYYAPAGYPAYRIKGVDEVKSLDDIVTKWL